MSCAGSAMVVSAEHGIAGTGLCLCVWEVFEIGGFVCPFFGLFFIFFLIAYMGGLRFY
jgi:hypothetical protein